MWLSTKESRKSDRLLATSPGDNPGKSMGITWANVQFVQEIQSKVNG